jgi:hypothetical protein
MDFNFSSAPQVPRSVPEPGAWRSGNRLIVDSRRPVLPDRCPESGTTDDLEEVEIPIKFFPVGQPWYRLALYLSTGVLGASILKSRFGELLWLQGAVSTKSLNRRRRIATIGWYLLATGIILLLCLLLHVFKANRVNPELIVYMLGGGAICLLLGLLAVWHCTRNLLAYVRTEGDLVVLAGAHQDFLSALPDFAARMGQANSFTRAKQRSASYGALAHVTMGLGSAIVLAECALFFFSRAIELPADVSQAMRDFAFWGGLAGVHIAVLAGVVLIWFSQSSLEWRLGLAASVPLIALVMIGGGQDFWLIKSGTQAANRQVTRVKKQNSRPVPKQKTTATTAKFPSDAGFQQIPKTRTGPTAEPLGVPLTDTWFRSPDYRLGVTDLRTALSVPIGAWSIDDKEFFFVVDGQTINRIQVSNMIATHRIRLRNTICAMGAGKTRLVVATNDPGEVLMFNWPQMGLNSPSQIFTLANVLQVVGQEKSPDLIVRFLDSKRAERWLQLSPESGQLVTERGLKNDSAALLMQYHDSQDHEQRNRERWRQVLAKLKENEFPRQEQQLLAYLLFDIRSKSTNHYFPDHLGRRVIVVGKTLSIISRERDIP